MSLHARQPTLLRMLIDPNAPTTPNDPSTPPSAASEDASPNRTELEPTPLLLALDMAAERKRLRKRKDSVLTGAEEDYVQVSREDAGTEDGEKMNVVEEDGKEVVIVLKEDLSQLAILGRTVSNGFWNGVEGVRKGVWGLAGWA